MSHSILILPVTMTKFEPLADRSLKLTLVTMREAYPEEVSACATLYQQHIQCALKQSRIEDEEALQIPDISPKLISGKKSHSERYQAVIYVYWKSNGGAEKLGLFEDYYKRWMEQQIQRVKDLLPTKTGDSHE